jgi:hypothetical protein
MLTRRPDEAQDISKHSMIVSVCLALASANSCMLSAKHKCETFVPPLPTLKGFHAPVSTDLTMSWDNLSRNRTKRYGDNESPWWIPLVGLEAAEGLPFHKTLSEEFSMQVMINVTSWGGRFTSSSVSWWNPIANNHRLFPDLPWLPWNLFSPS